MMYFVYVFVGHIMKDGSFKLIDFDASGRIGIDYSGEKLMMA